MDIITLAPMLWLGYCQSIQTSWHTSQDISGPCVTLETNPDRLGAHLKFSQDFVALGIQYGLSYQLSENTSVVFKLGGGGLYSNTIHPSTGVRQITKFEFTSAVEFHYNEYGARVGYTHGSNGKGFDPTNHGQDMVEFVAGYQFK